MDTAFISTLLDRGIVIGLFVITFLWAIYKGIPAAIKFFQNTIDKINAEHTHQITMLVASHEKTLETITQRFIVQIEKQHVEAAKYHEEHGKILSNIQATLNAHERTLKSKR